MKSKLENAFAEDIGFGEMGEFVEPLKFLPYDDGIWMRIETNHPRGFISFINVNKPHDSVHVMKRTRFLLHTNATLEVKYK